MNFAKMKFPGTPIPRRRKRDKPPIKQRLDYELLQNNSGTAFYFGAQPIEQRSFHNETELLETSEPVPISIIQQTASLHSLPDDIKDLPQEASDHGHIGTQSSNHSQDQKSSEVKADVDLDRLEWLREALEQSERKRKEERKRHEYREKELMETIQAMSDFVNGYEKEILKQKKEISKQNNVEQDLVQNLVSVLDELEVVRREKLMYEDETINLRVHLAQTDEDHRALGEQVKSERQQKEQLLIQIEQERQIRIAIENLAEVERRRFQALKKQMKDDLHNERTLQKKKQEIEGKVGVPVKVRRVDNLGPMRDEDLHKLTPAMITQMKTVTEQFAKLHPIKKIEYIMNDSLYKQFNETRAKFRSTGRGTKEVLVFHGTDRKNINSILSNGFAIGGVNSHPVAHGSSMGHGVYCATDVNLSAGFNVGNDTEGPRMIAVRALLGTVSKTPMYGAAGQIGSDTYDSYHSRDAYVIRRSCQTLPCFLIYY